MRYGNLLAIGGLVALLSSPANATCHAKDMDFATLMAVTRDLEDAVQNLTALKHETRNRDAAGLLSLTEAKTDGLVGAAAAFGNYLLIYGKMAADHDRGVVDGVIESAAELDYSGAKELADQLTNFATVAPLGAEEIRATRDRVRKVQSFFSCAAAAK